MKDKTPRHKEYLKFVRTLPCCICEIYGEQFSAVPHHTQTGGVSLKGSDLLVIPLCLYHHTGRGGVHNIGKITFYQDHNTKVEELIAKTMRQWEVENETV